MCFFKRKCSCLEWETFLFLALSLSFSIISTDKDHIDITSNADGCFFCNSLSLFLFRFLSFCLFVSKRDKTLNAFHVLCLWSIDNAYDARQNDDWSWKKNIKVMITMEKRKNVPVYSELLECSWFALLSDRISHQFSLFFLLEFLSFCSTTDNNTRCTLLFVFFPRAERIVNVSFLRFFLTMLFASSFLLMIFLPEVLSRQGRMFLND